MEAFISGGFSVLRILINPYIIAPPIVVAFGLYFVFLHYLKSERARVLVVPGRTASKYTTVAGEYTERYYDIDKACTRLGNTQRIVNWYVDNIKEIHKKTKIDSLAFIERDAGPVGAITKKDVISLMTDIPSFAVRPRKRIHSIVIKGAEKLTGQKVAVISDVATTGASINKVVDILRNRKAEVVAAITVLNRGGDALTQDFKKRSIEFRFAGEAADLEREYPQSDS